jgi:hypothetical protein
VPLPRAPYHSILMLRRTPMAAIAATWIVLASATGARAATVPTGSVVRVPGPLDLPAFARTIAARYKVVLHRIVAADIDRDGDLDVLATTGRDLLVWLNDGAGRLTSSKIPAQSPGIDARAPDDTWRDDGNRPPETIQNELPSPRLTSAFAHAPPQATCAACPPTSGPVADRVPTAASPRAPPAPGCFR